MSDFQFLRPFWLLLLLFVPLIYLILRSHARGNTNWQQVIPAALLKPLMPSGSVGGSSSRWPRILPPLLLTIAALAMAGPSFRTAPSPLQQQNDSLVVVLDLSLSMLARDVEPDRLTRATRKIRDLLASREGAYTGLVVYAADGHVVTPLTDDRRTVEGLLSAVDPIIMPATGNRADLGVARAVELLDQGAPGRGRILLITDGLNPHYAEAIRQQLSDKDWELDGLMVGTENGAPIPIPERGFIRDGDQIVISRASLSELENAARQSGGQALPMTTADQDLRQLQLRAEDHNQWQDTDEDHTTTRRQDDGYWLLWLVLPLALLGWRRGALAVITVSLVWLPSGPARALDWDGLWQTPEQRAPELIREDPASAASQLSDPLWKGTAMYRGGQYEGAANAFSFSDSADGHYNRGNALAQAGQPDAALSAWEKALELDPGHEGARHNQQVVRDYLAQQEKEKQQQQSDTSSDQDGQEQQNKQDGDQHQPSPGEQSGQQDGEQNQSGGQQDGGPQGQQAGQNPQDSQSAQGDDQPTPEEADQQAAEAQSGSQQQGKPTNTDVGQSMQEGDADSLSQSQQQWLRRIPDNPGGLLRRKFMQQSQNRNIQPDENDTPW